MKMSFDSSNSVGYSYAELSNTWNNVSDFDPYRFGDKSWLLPNTPPTILFPLENPYNYFSYTENCADPNQGNCNFDTYKNSFKVENSFSNENFIYAKGYLTAKLSFFAWANDNQMPLREIKINWGDGNAIFGDNETGYYKNKKPICGDESGQINVLKLDNKEFGLCSVDDKDRGCAAVIENESFSSVTECFCKLGVEGPLFGNQKGLTCDEEPYVFVWNYNCEISQTQKDDYEDAKKEDNFIGYLKTINFIKVGDMKSGLPGDGVVITDTQFGLPEWYKFLTTQRGLSDDNFVCVYQPMVQVKDNWDWRNSGEHDTACNFADAWTRYNNILVVSP